MEVTLIVSYWLAMIIKNLGHTIKIARVLLTVFLLTVAYQSVAADAKVEKKIENNKAGRATGATANSNGRKNSVEFENEVLRMVVIPRGPEQMKAFYEGRGFPKPALGAITQACFMTVIVKNKSGGILWLDLSKWRFASAFGEVPRLQRSFWNQQWQALQVPMANRSTFGWTLLPESRDLQPDEGVGGNITLTATQQPFDLIANFLRGDGNERSTVTVQLTQLRCGE